MGNLRLVSAWQRQDPEIEAHALAYWSRLQALPRGVDPAKRLKELCAVAYYDADLVGVSTVRIGDLQPFPCRFAFFRCSTSPNHSLLSLGRKLALLSRDICARWSKSHPEENVLGSVAVLENPKADSLAQIPVWKVPGLSNGWTLAGYTDNGLQVRIHWYDHARLDRPMGRGA